MSFFDAALNAGSGGLLGLVGSLTTGVLSLFQAKSQFKHDEAVAQLNIDMTKLQGDIASKVAEANFKALVEKGANDNFVSSQVGANNTSIPWIDGLMKLWRPTLTVILMALTFYFYANGTPDLRSYITQAIVELTSMAVAWWWGSRQLEKFVASKPQ